MKGLGWLLQLLTGLVLTLLVGYHFVVTHITGSLEIEDVLTRFHELKMFYVILLVVVAYHAFNGLRIITIELGRRSLSNLFYAMMILAVAYGLFLLFSI